MNEDFNIRLAETRLYRIREMLRILEQNVEVCRSNRLVWGPGSAALSAVWDIVHEHLLRAIKSLDTACAQIGYISEVAIETHVDKSGKATNVK